MIPDTAAAIRRARQKTGLTQDQLAETLNVSRQTISNWENGRTEPDIKSLDRLDALLDLRAEAPAAAGAEKAPPVAAEPFPRARKKSAGKIALLSAALLLIAAVALMLLTQPRRATDLTPEWFKAPQENLPDRAFVELFSKYNPLGCPAAEEGVERCWDFRLVMHEVNGYLFSGEKIRFVFYYKNGGNRVQELPGSFLASAGNEFFINGGFARIFRREIPYEENLCGLGVLLYGRDENGYNMNYHYYQELQ